MVIYHVFRALGLTVEILPVMKDKDHEEEFEDNYITTSAVPNSATRHPVMKMVGTALHPLVRDLKTSLEEGWKYRILPIVWLNHALCGNEEIAYTVPSRSAYERVPYLRSPSLQRGFAYSYALNSPPKRREPLGFS